MTSEVTTMSFFSTEIMQLLAQRTKAYRIEYPMTQKQLADRSGVSERCIQMFESGKDIQLSNMIKILDALDLSDNLQLLVPDVSKRPSMFVEHTKVKQRAHVTQAKPADGFKWGDE